MSKMMNVQQLGFGLELEFKKRLCRECRMMKQALHTISYKDNGFRRATVYAICMPCAKKYVDTFSETIKAAQDEDAYILAANL